MKYADDADIVRGEKLSNGEQCACADALTPYTPGRPTAEIRTLSHCATIHNEQCFTWSLKWPAVMVTIQNAFLRAESHLVWRGIWTKDERQQLLHAFEQDELSPDRKEVKQLMTDVSRTLTGAALDMRTLKNTHNKDRRLHLESRATQATRYNGKSKEIGAKQALAVRK
jgi:hypothetical protein